MSISNSTLSKPPQHLLEIPPPENDVVASFAVGYDSLPSTADESKLTPGLTVAVCAYKRPHSLRSFLDSLIGQKRKPEHLVIVDASPDDLTEKMVREYPTLDQLADRVRYYHVRGALDTLTCSRNFTLRRVTTELMVFFDDDVVLEPDCLLEMEAVHIQRGDSVVGVGAVAVNHITKPQPIWRFRRFFNIVPTLAPGKYVRSGFATSWSFLPATEEVVEGDWLGGFAMMWKTALARQIGFNEGFGGHSMGEDLDFGVRMAQHGQVFVAGKAHLDHMVEPAGRPNTYMIGYTGIRNAHSIHKRCLPHRTWRDAAWFWYAYATDSFLRLLASFRPGNIKNRWMFLLGRLRYACEAWWTK
jgi:GT2 family glycosyltransferase